VWENGFSVWRIFGDCRHGQYLHAYLR